MSHAESPTISIQLPTARSHFTLVLCGLLHTLTHVFQTLLVPLYFLVQQDLHLRTIQQASLLVTVYGVIYFISSYPAGVLADRYNRRNLLGIGLLVNATAFVLIGLTRDYHMILALAVIAGFAGSLFHPAANALVPEHYPKSPAMAIGLLGIGSGLGFFFGPQLGGWRAEAANWHIGSMLIADWQRPCIEAGLCGLVLGVLFLLMAREARNPHVHANRRHQPMGAELRSRVIAIASVLAMRDFAGVAGLTLASIYLQKAFDVPVQRTGLIVGSLALPSVIGNPLIVYLSHGRRRLPTLAVVLAASGLFLAAVPYSGLTLGVLLLGMFYLMQFASYAISDAATLERIPAALRGRVSGLFLSIAGTVSALGPWAMGRGTDSLGPVQIKNPHAYLPLFLALAIPIMVSAFAALLINRLGSPTGPPINPLSEIDVGTVEAIS